MSTLEASRTDLLRNLDRLNPSEFARPEIADRLWQVGLRDDWTRLVVDQALGGRPLAAPNHRARPVYLATEQLLRAWLDQTRAALVARARRLGNEDLDRAVDLDEGRQTCEALLRAASDLESACARAIRSTPS